jgi:hypothetical protein
LIDPKSYVTPGTIGRALIRERNDGGRYLTFDPAIADREGKGFLYHQAPSNWPAYANGRSVLFGLSELQGYSPVQLMRYWRYLRAVDTDAPIYYNSATFQSDDASVLDLFGVEWVIQPTSLGTPPPGGVAVAEEGDWTLYRINDPAPRASLYSEWRVVSPANALRDATTPSPNSADPVSNEPLWVNLERRPTVDGKALSPPTFGPVLGPGAAPYRQRSDEHAQIRVRAEEGGVVLIRNPWDRNWQATVDGKPAPLLHADYVMQGVAVPAGTHTIDLYYRDTAIGIGLLISAVSWLLLLIAFVVLRRRESRGVSRAAESSPQRSEPPRDTEPVPAG